MSITRRFLLAPSLARLIEKERGGHRVREGYFPDQSERSISRAGRGGHGHARPGQAWMSGERWRRLQNLPHAHAEALLGFAAVASTTGASISRIGTHGAHVSRFTAPGELDLIAVDFEREEQAREFQPRSWFGPEVTTQPGYQNRYLALKGRPDSARGGAHKRGPRQPAR